MMTIYITTLIRYFSVGKREGDIKKMYDNCKDEIQGLLGLNETLDGQLAEKYEEIKSCRAALADKDAEVGRNESMKEDLGRQIIAMRVNREKRESVVGPLRIRLDAAEEAVKNVSRSFYF